MKLITPNHGRNLVNMSNSIRLRYGLNPFHPTLKEIDDLLQKHDRVVFLLFDGMGKHIIQEHAKPNSGLLHHRHIPIYSTFPATTVAATNGFLTSRYPIETGWLGWMQYFADIDMQVDVFTNQESWQKITIPGDNIMDKVALKNNVFDDVKNARSDIRVEQIWPSFRPNGATSTRQFFRKLNRSVKGEDKLLMYGYWIEPDKSLHHEGLGSKSIKRTIDLIDRKLTRLTRKHKDTLFLVFADHGLTPIEYLDIDEHEDLFKLLKRPFANEPRAASFFVQDGAHQAFEKLFNEYYGDYFILKSQKEVLDEKWFGQGEPSNLSLSFLGDYLAVAKDKYAFHYTKARKKTMVAHHAGILDQEVEVDVVVYNENK